MGDGIGFGGITGLGTDTVPDRYKNRIKNEVKNRIKNRIEEPD